MESEPSGIFWVKQVAKNIVLGSPGTHFMHMRVKYVELISFPFLQMTTALSRIKEILI